MPKVTAPIVKPKKTTVRTADYAIQGFLYQLNKTLLSILESSDDAEIVVEGVIEDIDVHELASTTAIQCKYHESRSKFTLSLIYKPILQILNHFHAHPSQPISYRIYCYCPDKESGSFLSISVKELEDLLESKNQDLADLIKQVKNKVDLPAFIAKIRVEFGMELSKLISSVHAKFWEFGFSIDDVPTLFYPNAIHIIATTSINHDITKRRMRKREFIDQLSTMRKTMISRWTLLLKTKVDLMKAKRTALKANMSKNVRRRSFLISKASLSDFDSGIVVFISEFIDKYHSKPAHSETPLFCLDCDLITFADIRLRIFQKGIRFNDGFVGDQFIREHFSRAPLVTRTRDRADREFLIRLLRYETDHDALYTPLYDDLFVISAIQYDRPIVPDVNEEYLATENLLQTKYLLGVSDVYE